MANPGFGNFLGGFGQAFNRARLAKDESKRRDEIAKLQAKLVEAQITAGNVVVDAKTKIGDLMTGSRTQLALGDIDKEGIGTFRPTGARVDSPNEPMGLSELLSDPEGMFAALQSGQVKISDLIGGGQQPSAFTRDAILADKIPGTPAYVEAFERQYGQDEQAIASAELLASIQEEKVLKAQGERTDKAEEKRKLKVRGRLAVKNHFVLVNEAIALQRDLQKTVLQSGIPGGEKLRDISAVIGAIQEKFGKDSPQSKIIVEQRDRLKKLLSVSLVNSIKSMKGVVSVARQAALELSLPSLENSAVANAQLFGDQMRTLLDEAEINEFEVGGRDFIEQFIADPLAGLQEEAEAAGPAFIDTATDTARSVFDTVSGKAQSGFDAASAFAKDAAASTSAEIERRKPQAELLAKKAAIELRPFLEKAKAGTIKVVEMAKLTLEDVQQLTAEDIKNWTKEQRAALEKRLDALGL